MIVEAGGRTVENAGDLRLKAGLTEPGTALPVTIVRGGQRQDLELKVGQAPSRPRAAPQAPQGPQMPFRPR